MRVAAAEVKTSLANLLTAVSPALAQSGERFRGLAQSVNGSVLTVAKCTVSKSAVRPGLSDMMASVQISQTARVCTSKVMTYSNKEPYRAVSVQSAGRTG